MLNLKLFPAEYGDCIWIEYAGERNINILIDGGTTKTYQNFIKQEIKKIKELEQKMDLIICTHIDYDHIGGLVQLLKNTESQIINSVWYNGFLQIIDSKYYTQIENEYSARDYKILDDFINKGTRYNGKQKIGINEGIALGTLLEEKKISINTVTEGKVISAETIKKIIKFTEGLKITVLGPSIERIQDLENYWKKEMVSRNYVFRVSNKIKLMKAFEYQLEAIKLFYAEEQIKISGQEKLEKYIGNLTETDNSITNGSSISFIVHYKDKKYLFLGDAIIDDILLKRIESVVGYKYRFSAIKLPHHGSRYNITDEFIKRYKANEYYCLTNAKRFEHPDLEVLATIICNDSVFKTIVFNYPINKAHFLNNHEWKEKYNYEVIIGTGENPIERIFK